MNVETPEALITAWLATQQQAMTDLLRRAVDIIASGAEPLRELIGSMHSKMLLAELRRQRTPAARAAGGT